LLLAPLTLLAQDEVRKVAKAADTGDADEIPPPEELSLPTKDGLKLAATFYPGTRGKNSVPVILLHGFKGSRKDYAEVAPYLQARLGCAVIVPDLRGHGESTSFQNDKTITVDKLRAKDFLLMVPYDLDAIMDYLREENNGYTKENKKPRLNLNKLCIVGADVGAALALEFAREDWSRDRVGSYQMGHFTKALVLISPEASSHGLRVATALKHPEVRSKISFLILFGQNGAAAKKDAKVINTMLQPFHPEPDAENKEKKNLFFRPLDTNLQGVKILEEKSLNVPALIEQFILYRLIKSEEAKTYTWSKLRKDAYVPEKGE
jgi:pimeloyl-ACP methyl ester carboxylesterase